MVLGERDIYKLAAPTGRFSRRKQRLHFKVDSHTVWHVFFVVLGVHHPWLAMYQARYTSK